MAKEFSREYFQEQGRRGGKAKAKRAAEVGGFPVTPAMSKASSRNLAKARRVLARKRKQARKRR